MTSKIHKFTLDNGIRLLVEPVDYVQSVSIGIGCKTGSRHELDREAGITHVIEHMFFKGTPTRNAKEIAETIEERGGYLNAFTDKEQTCYYCRLLGEDTEVGVDVLTDIVMNSLINEEELSKEKGVILEEIKRSEDDPAEHVHEIHFSERWGHHPLGKPVIGTPESVSSFERPDLIQYMDRQYRAENIVISIAGAVDPEKFREAAAKRLQKVPKGATQSEPEKPTGTHKIKEVSREIEQVHFCIGTDSYPLYDLDSVFAVGVLDGILGGGMSSRLFQEVREKRGLVYAIGSYNVSYGAGGAFTVYGGTSMEAWPLVQEVIRTEFDKIIKGELDENELEKVKKNLSGHLVLGLESMSARMLRMIRNELFHQRDIPVEETLRRISAVTKDQVISKAQEMLKEDLVSTTAIGPF